MHALHVQAGNQPACVCAREPALLVKFGKELSPGGMAGWGRPARRRTHVACCESFLALGWRNGMNQACRDITRMKKSPSNFVLVTGTRPGILSHLNRRIEGGAGEFPHACTWITCCICIRTIFLICGHTETTARASESISLLIRAAG